MTVHGQPYQPLSGAGDGNQPREPLSDSNGDQPHEPFGGKGDGERLAAVENYVCAEQRGSRIEESDRQEYEMPGII